MIDLHHETLTPFGMIYAMDIRHPKTRVLMKRLRHSWERSTRFLRRIRDREASPPILRRIMAKGVRCRRRRQR